MSSQNSNRKPKILIAEDKRGDAVICEAILKRTGQDYTFLYASDGIEARSKAKSEHPDLIILDSQMRPTGDEEGLQVLLDLRSDPNTNTIPVVAITHLPDDALP